MRLFEDSEGEYFDFRERGDYGERYFVSGALDEPALPPPSSAGRAMSGSSIAKTCRPDETR